MSIELLVLSVIALVLGVIEIVAQIVMGCVSGWGFLLCALLIGCGLTMVRIAWNEYKASREP